MTKAFEFFGAEFKKETILFIFAAGMSVSMTIALKLFGAGSKTTQYYFHHLDVSMLPSLCMHDTFTFSKQQDSLSVSMTIDM